jgi:hypothetical protein
MRTLTTALLALLAINCTEGGSAQTGEEQNLTQKERADQKIPGALSCQVQLGEGQVAADACAYASEDELGACISLVTLFPSSAGVGLGVTRRFVSETREAKTMATLEGDAIDIRGMKVRIGLSRGRRKAPGHCGAGLLVKTTCHATATDSSARVLPVLAASRRRRLGVLPLLSVSKQIASTGIDDRAEQQEQVPRTVNSDGET